MQKDTEKLVQNTSWEKEFDRAFASPSWSPAPMKKIFDELMQDGVKPFIRKTLAQREKEIADEVKKKVGLMRQWLNEDRITDNNKMVTSEELLHWLKH